ncbi:MAG: hypothetical protein KBT46_02565 [Ruminococcus sp.]|nr:hypothetical protein [Candidatus Copronaster equi]
MKKSVVIISVLIIISSILFVSCGKANEIVDINGVTHKFSTNKDGSPVQDDLGWIREEVTDKNGKKSTALYTFPSMLTNKRQHIAENVALRFDLGDDWEAADAANIFRINHKGKCSELKKSPCEIEIKTDTSVDRNSAYNTQLESVNLLQGINTDMSDLKELKTKICGKEALGISYRNTSDKSTTTYYCFQKGFTTVELFIITDDSCYNEKSLTELLNSRITLKKLKSDDLPTTKATETTTENTITNTTTSTNK